MENQQSNDSANNNIPAHFHHFNKIIFVFGLVGLLFLTVGASYITNNIQQKPLNNNQTHPRDGIKPTIATQISPTEYLLPTNAKAPIISIIPPSAKNGCAPAGCSGELCVEADKANDIVSTCVYKEEYGCYKNVGNSCERQKDGKCGWTESTALTLCINKAHSSNVNTPQ